MPFITQGKANIKYILIVVILAVIVGGGILSYQYWWVPKHETKILEVKLPEVKSPEVKTQEQSAGAETNGPDIYKKLPKELADIAFEETIKNYQFGESWNSGVCQKQGMAASIQSFDAEVSEVDLNNDSIKEFIILPFYFCGTFRGAAGNGDIYIYQKIKDSWSKIGEMQGNQYDVKKEKTNGYYDIESRWHMSAGEQIVSIYQWQDNYYKKISEKPSTGE